MIAYSAADLVWASRIKQTGLAVGVECRPVRSVAMLRERLGDSAVRALLVDLDAAEVGMELIAELRGPHAGAREQAVRVVAWGPHVATGLLSAARDAGADEVLTRGAMASGLEAMLVRLEGAAPG